MNFNIPEISGHHHSRVHHHPAAAEEDHLRAPVLGPRLHQHQLLPEAGASATPLPPLHREGGRGGHKLLQHAEVRDCKEDKLFSFYLSANYSPPAARPRGSTRRATRATPRGRAPATPPDPPGPPSPSPTTGPSLHHTWSSYPRGNDDADDDESDDNDDDDDDDDDDNDQGKDDDFMGRARVPIQVGVS